MDARPEQEIDRELIARLGAAALDDERVLFIYVFGSVARGTPGAHSDVDLAVYVREPGGLVEDARLHDRLAAAAGRDDTDVVILNDAPLWLAYRVVGEGVVAFSCDERRRVAFRARTEHEFLDFRHYHDAYLAAVRERARQGTLSRG